MRPRIQRDPMSNFIMDTLLPIVRINEERTAALTAALGARGWDFAGYHLGPTVYEATVTFRTRIRPPTYYVLKVKVPAKTPRDRLDDKLKDALIRKIGRCRKL